jgi:general secretion pathway protein J
MKDPMVSLPHWGNGPNGTRDHGFTLLELMISLTIVALVLVVIFGGFRVGIRAWEKGETDTTRYQKERIVMAFIKRQIASMCVRRLLVSDTEKGSQTSARLASKQKSSLVGSGRSKSPFWLEGDEKSMAFLSNIPIVPRDATGLVYVKYLVEPGEAGGENLKFYEKNIVMVDDEHRFDESNEDNMLELLTDKKSIRFEYLKPEEESQELEWLDRWDPETEERFPGAVKIIFEDDGSDPLQMVARIIPETEER